MTKRDEIEGSTVFAWDRVVGEDGKRIPHIRITCSQCGANANRPAHTIQTLLAARIFHNIGWQVDDKGRRAICPKCQEKARMTKVQSISPSATRGTVRVIQLLSEHFDIEAGRFADDWSDEKIATATEISIEQVRRYRDEGFGPLKPPSEIQMLKDEIAAMTAKVDNDLRGIRGLADDLKKELSALTAKVDQVCNRYGKAA